MDIGGHQVGLNVETRYPYEGSVKVTVNPATPTNFALKLRVPSWVEGIGVEVNGRSEKFGSPSGFATIDRTWKKGDTVKLTMDMPVRRVISHPSVKETFGKYAFERGPLVYCLEGVDNKFDLDQIGIPMNGAVSTKSVKGLFGDTTVIDGDAFLTTEQPWTGKLFASTAAAKAVKFRAIPYCFWDNRGAGEMRVWVSPNPVPSPIRGMEKKAKVSVSFLSPNSDIDGINDGYIPSDSNQNSPKQLHFWPHKGGQEWVQYTFPTVTTVSSSIIYWFDDTGHGECRVPKAWVLQVRNSSGWTTIPLKSSEKFGLTLNAWNEIHFAPTAGWEFRILVDQQSNWASGIHEWQIY